MKFNTTFRAEKLFPNTLSESITIGKAIQNDSSKTGEDLKAGLHKFMVGSLNEEATPQLFYAAGKLCPTLSIKGHDSALSILDVIILSIATIMTNDTLSFLNEPNLSFEETSTSESISVVREKRSKAVFKPVKEMESISDELRDELSGANIVPGSITPEDNECKGGSCKL